MSWQHQKSYQSKITEWQKKAHHAQAESGAGRQQEYALMQQNYQSRKDALQQEFGIRIRRPQDSIRKRIEEFLKEYKSRRPIPSSLPTIPAPFIYYKDTSTISLPTCWKG